MAGMPRLLVFLALVLTATAQTHPAVKAARQWRQAHERAILEEYFGLLAIPNVSADRVNVRRNAQHIQKMIEQRGLKARLLEVPGASPVVYGEWKNPKATRTIVFYAHYDGQPVSPKDWATPPFEPALKTGPPDRDPKVIPWPAPGQSVDPEWRIYARAAADDKAPIQALLTALDALKAAGLEPTINIKFAFEGEEEAGSEHLEAILKAHRELLEADLWLFCDGPVDQSRKQQITFGARGIQTVDLTVYGPKRELHSGHYGNWAPNPAMMLARLLASMKDDDGRITIEGFYDGLEPLSELDKQAVRDLPDNDAALKKDLLLGASEGNRTLAEAVLIPSLNIRGMASSGVGAQASNVVPATATAALDIRLVKGITTKHVVEKLRRHIEKQGFFITDREPDAETRLRHAKVVWMKVSRDGYEAVRTSLSLPLAEVIVRNVEAGLGRVIKRPTTGGTVPVYIIQQALGKDTIQIPIVNHDNNQHTHNENLRVQNLWDGIELMAILLTLR
jgi:acetylornithine deacetylase/succinyl-diaminopimelate desuccinylase-like protein